MTNEELAGLAELPIEHCTELMRIIMLYCQAKDLRAGLTLVIADGHTIRTAGNMDAAQQAAAFRVLADRLAGTPDMVVEIDETTGKEMSHATH